MFIHFQLYFASLIKRLEFNFEQISTQNVFVFFTYNNFNAFLNLSEFKLRFILLFDKAYSQSGFSHPELSLVMDRMSIFSMTENSKILLL